MKTVFFFSLLALSLAPTGSLGDEVAHSDGFDSIEIGVSLGTPAGLNLTLGKWGVGNLPLLARISSGYYGEELNGIQIDLGYVFDTEGNFKQYIVGSWLHANIKDTDFANSIRRLDGVGAGYGFNWGGFGLQAGLVVSGSGDFSFPQLSLQLGYSHLL